MPTTEFSFKEFTALVGRDLTPKEVRDRASMLGVDVERIDEERIVMEVFPNRPDMLCVEGFARAYRGVTGIESGLASYEVRDSDVLLRIDPSVQKVRPFIAAGIVRNVSFTEERLVSLMNLQEKLHITHGRNRKKVAIGVHDLSKVEGPFLYTAVDPCKVSFIPLDSTEEMNLSEILERHPKGKTYAPILAGMKEYPAIFDRNKNVLSFPPIINGELTRVKHTTRDLFIDVTGLDDAAVKQALNILVSSILERGGTAYSVNIF